MSESNRQAIIDMIIAERMKQQDTMNADYTKTKNDWCSLAGYYLFESSSREDKHVSFEEFRQSLIKTSAILLAAIETSLDLESSKDITNILQEIEKSKH